MSKVNDNPGASEKFLKKEAQAQGVGADNAPGHTGQSLPQQAPVVEDSGNSANIGIRAVDNKASNHITSEDQKQADNTPDTVNIAGAPTANVPAEAKFPSNP